MLLPDPKGFGPRLRFASFCSVPSNRVSFVSGPLNPLSVPSMQFCSVSHLDEVDDTDTGSIRFSQMTPALLVREEFGGGGSL